MPKKIVAQKREPLTTTPFKIEFAWTSSKRIRQLKSLSDFYGLTPDQLISVVAKDWLEEQAGNLSETTSISFNDRLFLGLEEIGPGDKE